MTSITVSLSDEMRDWIHAQIAGGGYTNVSEYVRELVRGDQSRREEERLQRLLLEGIESGDDGPMTKADWEDVRQNVRQRIQDRAARHRSSS